MPLRPWPRSRQFDYLAFFGGLLILLDTSWGGILALGAGLDPPREALMTVGLVLGLPMYMIDVWSRSRVVIFLAALLLFRLTVVDLGWPGDALLVPAAILLQLSKLDR